MSAIICFMAIGCKTTSLDSLRKNLQDYTNGVDATVGIAVITSGGDTLTVNNGVHYPMMSVFKFHQALGVSAFLAEKQLPLDTKIEVRSSDLQTDTWSPLRDKYPDGGVEITVAEALGYTLQQSDNLVCDMLFDRFVDTDGVEAFIKRQGVEGVAIRYNEVDMYGDHMLSYANWSTPYAAALLLDKFIDGKVIGEPYYDCIRDLMLGCETGVNRLARPFEGSGYKLGHKTGSGYVDAAGRLMACNDIGFVLSPEGKKAYVIAVFVRDSGLTEKETEDIIATVSSMVKEALLE